jgi:two-component system cell cycle sensor histidine kinase/response regulator CckA
MVSTLVPSRILLIDDNDEFRTATQALLEEHGHRTLAAGNPVKALQVFSEFKDKIDVVLLDYLMPGMDGAKTLAHLRRLKPDIKVVLLSGAEELRLRRAFGQQPIDGYLRKPVLNRDLVAMLGKLTPTATAP